MKLKDITYDKIELKNKIIDYIRNLNLKNHLVKSGDLIYNSDDFIIEDYFGDDMNNIDNNINNMIEKIDDLLEKFIEKFIDKISYTKLENDLFVVIKSANPKNEDGMWKMTVEDRKNGDFYMQITTKILEKLNK